MSDETAELKKVWGERIKNLRKRLGLTQKQLAERLDAEETSVARWENGAVAPKGDTLYQLLDMARDIGYVWEFTGATLAGTYEAMLDDPKRLTGNGVHVFLDMQLAGPQHFIDVLTLLAEQDATFHRFGTPGTDVSESTARAFALFTLPGPFEEIRAKLKQLSWVLGFKVKWIPTEVVTEEYSKD